MISASVYVAIRLVSRNVGRFGCMMHLKVHFWVHKTSRIRTFSTTYALKRL